jgi:dihydroneopterin aldolase
MDWVKINGLELDCIVGIYPHERQTEQRVRLDLALQVDTKRAGRSGRIGHTVDYAVLAEHVIAMLHFRRYQLVEMAAEELCAMVLATQPEATAVELRIEKPGALAGRASGAQIVVSRTASDYDTSDVPCTFGKEHELLRTRDAELRVISLDRGQSWQPAERSLYWPVRGELLSEIEQLRAGQTRMSVSPTEPWRNAGQREVLIFCCTLTTADQ